MCVDVGSWDVPVQAGVCNVSWIIMHSFPVAIDLVVNFIRTVAVKASGADRTFFSTRCLGVLRNDSVNDVLRRMAWQTVREVETGRHHAVTARLLKLHPFGRGSVCVPAPLFVQGGCPSLMFAPPPAAHVLGRRGGRRISSYRMLLLMLFVVVRASPDDVSGVSGHGDD